MTIKPNVDHSTTGTTAAFLGGAELGLDSDFPRVIQSQSLAKFGLYAHF